MSNRKIILAYHSANGQVAYEIDRNLSQADYTFEHLNCDGDELRLYERIQQAVHPVILLISDNFLRCENCMYELLPTFQELIRANRIKAIVTDGVYKDAETGIVTSKPTSFDRVSNVIQYMNYWQDQYLEVRRQKRQLSSEEEIILNEQLRVIRSISSEIGEFLRFLRNRDYTTYEEFRANNFYPFFAFTNDLNTHRNFTALPFEETIEEDTEETIKDDIIANESSDEPITEETVVETVTAAENEAETELAESITDPINDVHIVEEVAPVEIDETSAPAEEAMPEEAVEVPDLSNFFEEQEEIELPELDEVLLELNAESDAVQDVEHEAEIPTEAQEDIPAAVPFEEVTVPLDTVADQIETVLEEEMPNIEAASIDLSATIPVEDTTLEIAEVEKETAAAEEEDVQAVSAEQQLQIDARESVDAIIVHGNELIQEGQVYTALRRFEEGLLVYPESPALRYTFAKAILKYREDFAGTRKQLEKLLQYDTKNTDAYFLLGELDEIQENYTAAKL
ncbi:MAG: hypothetical protein AAF847_07715, partial [Bacteroidota bacterium]